MFGKIYFWKMSSFADNIEQGVVMSFRFYTNMISQASRSLASIILIVGLLLIGFGIIILAFPEVFAFIAAGLSFVAGLILCTTAVKIYLAQRRFCNHADNQSYSSRETIAAYSDEHPSDDS